MRDLLKPPSMPPTAGLIALILGAYPLVGACVMDEPTITPVTSTELLDWAERILPTTFPPGATNKTLATPSGSFTYRHYPSTNNYLGTGDQDGLVYLLGPSTANQLTSLGKLADWTCDVRANCAFFQPDSDGNLATPGLQGIAQVSLRVGQTLQFQNLTPLDSIIEVNSPSLTSDQLCHAADLPPGSAHAAPAQYPLPASHYANNELSGPYRTYPVGLFPMSIGSSECGYIEKKTACIEPNERLVPGGMVQNPDGSTDYLCNPAPYLMDASNPTRPAHNPPMANPACIKGKTMDTIWADPAHQGVFIRLSWKDINPSYGSYDWSMLDRELTTALRHGKTVMLGLEVGGNSIPEWVFTTGDPGLGAAQKVVLKDWGTAADSMPNANCGFNWTVASPSDEAFKRLFKKTIADLGAHIRADQRRFSMISGIKVSGMGQATLENRLPKRCNIAVRNVALGDTGTQGHLIAMSSTDLAHPVFDEKYMNLADPSFGRIKDTSQCVCNPQVLQAAGYKPSVLRTFYAEVEATIAQNFGYKQQVFMNISDGFPQIGETGRYLGDHLAPPITRISWNALGEPVYTFGTAQATAARVPADIPDANDTTAALLADARAGVFAGGSVTAAKGFSVENAGLDVVGFSLLPNTGVRCSQQRDIAVTGALAGSPAFPIPAGTATDARTGRCPNVLATREGIDFDRPGGFQVVFGLESAAQIDAALWNMTLNTNGLFFEHYESNAWIAAKQSASNPGQALDPQPPIKTETATLNHDKATAKSAVQWNELLLARAKVFSENPVHDNPYQANPFRTQYALTLVPNTQKQRYFFNSRACKSYASSGTPVRINTLTILD